MIVNASALKSNYGAPNVLDYGSPLLGGSRTSGVRATRLNVSAPPVNTADQFADLIAQKATIPEQSGETQPGAADGSNSSKDPAELAGDLSRTTKFI